MNKPLHILAFDLDNTLLDPGSALYSALHRAFLSELPTDLPIESLLAEFERTRKCGDALERLGLRNPIHDRGHPESIAAMILTVPSPLLGHERATHLGEERRAFRAMLDRLRTLHDATAVGTPDETLRAELRLREELRTADEPRRLRRSIMELAERPNVQNLAERYALLEAEQTHPDRLPLLRRLADGEVTTVVVSQGRVAVQSIKLHRLGLAAFFDRRLLVTEGASHIPGCEELDRAIDRELDRGSRSAPPDEGLRTRWRYRCVLLRWRRKSPQFYARCLHAIARSPTEPQTVLPDLPLFPFDGWRECDVRFVMVGDRLDTDIDPVLASLGPEHCQTIHLRCGKYSEIAPRIARTHRAPHRTFAHWSEAEQYLLNDLDWKRVGTIESAPALLDDDDLDDRSLAAGMGDPLPIVRALADLAARTRRK